MTASGRSRGRVRTRRFGSSSGKLAGLAAAVPTTPAGREIAAAEATLASVGFLRNRRLKHPFSGTGFVIAPDMVATASFVVAGEGGSAFPDVAAGQIDFVLAERIGAPDARVFAVSEVVASIPGSLVLLRVPGLAAAGVRHVDLAAVGPATGAAVGVAGFVGGPDAKQLNLGEILAPAPEDERSGAGVLRYNVRTGSGTSGAPVLSVSDGRVVGVHMAVSRATGDGLGLALASVMDRLAAAGVPTP